MGTSVVMGFTGGLGRSTAKILLERGEKVIALIRNPIKAEKYAEGLKGIEFVQGDAMDSALLNKIFTHAETLFYCLNFPYQFWQDNARELLRTSVDAAAEQDVKFVFPGNVYVYGYPKYNPVDEKHPWHAHTRKGKIRIEMEDMINLHRKLRYTIIRLPDFYGPWVINTLSETWYKSALQNKRVIYYGSLDIPYEFIYIEDAARAMVEAGLSKKGERQQFNVSGTETTPKKYLEEIIQLAGSKSKILAIGSEMYVALGGLFNPLAKEFVEMMYLKKMKLLLNSSKYKQTFGEIPQTPYSVGIAATLEWIKSY
ncbi:MAG: NAD-dependent epimerase/dehydratase family protein, partial [Bacteroidota bacterium]|nr:NAD-dependent epimerase/dehydratase family protein [Bacteroidota bacterium]